MGKGKTNLNVYTELEMHENIVDKEYCVYFMLILSTILFGILMYCIYCNKDLIKWKRETIKRGYAEYIANKDGEPILVWKENK